MKRGGWTLAALLALLIVARVARGRGDLSVSIEYPAELRGTFTVRLLRQLPSSRRAHRPDPSTILKGGASTRSVHTLVTRETQFRRLRPGRYYVSVEGLLQASDTGEVLEDDPSH